MANNEDIKKCPCDTVIRLQEKVDNHEDRLAKGDTKFAVLCTKLNILIAILAAIGVALLGVCVQVLF